MSSLIRNQYQPDLVSPPGETLQETIDALGMSQAQLAERTGRPKKTINEIIQGKAAITPETALQLEHVCGVPAVFWNNRECQYREFLARQEEQTRLQDQVEWLKKIPVRAMIRLGWIEHTADKVQQLRVVLDFFGVATPDQWGELWRRMTVRYRTSRVYENDPGPLSAWLRKGELDAQQIDCPHYDAGRFRRALQSIRSLTRAAPEEFLPEVVRLSSEAGVAIAFVPGLPRLRVSGATRWLTPNKALIQLSLRYGTDDHLWFSFFHEAGHVLLHSKRQVFLENDIGGGADEGEANRFAADLLIPRAEFDRFVASGDSSKAALIRFADSLGIAPGIVVGRLQHGGVLPRSHCNDLKRRLTLAARVDSTRALAP